MSANLVLLGALFVLLPGLLRLGRCVRRLSLEQLLHCFFSLMSCNKADVSPRGNDFCIRILKRGTPQEQWGQQCQASHGLIKGD